MNALRLSATILAGACVLTLATAATGQVCGDADGDGQVTDTDGVQVLRAAALLSSVCTLRSCDVDGDGQVTDTDGVQILRKAVGLPVTGSCHGGGRLLQQLVSEAYTKEFLLSVPSPAIYNDDRSVDCMANGHLTTTLYLRMDSKTSTLYFMYMSRDGMAVTRQSIGSVVTPAGTFRTLAVVLRYAQTVSADALTLWQVAQTQINEAHATFARSRGYSAPIVVFDNTDVFVDANQVADPRSLPAVEAAAQWQGVPTDGYDFVISINMDPSLIEGGFATPGEGFVYVGNYFGQTTTLSAGDWGSIASTAYLHEVAHHWGWPGTHDWAPTCEGVALGFEPFLVPPILFGWEDVDGDGVPEILDDTPYGRPQ